MYTCLIFSYFLNVQKTVEVPTFRLGLGLLLLLLLLPSIRDKLWILTRAPETLLKLSSAGILCKSTVLLFDQLLQAQTPWSCQGRDLNLSKQQALSSSPYKHPGLVLLHTQILKDNHLFRIQDGPVPFFCFSLLGYNSPKDCYTSLGWLAVIVNLTWFRPKNRTSKRDSSITMACEHIYGRLS